LASTAAGFTSRSLEGSFGPDGTLTSEFAAPWSIAVDGSTGDLYLADLAAGTIEKFNSAHQPELFTGTSPQIVEGKLTGFGISNASQLSFGPTSHDLYVSAGGAGVSAYQPDGEPANFTAGPGAGTNELAGAEVCGTAVDAHGDIYESEFSSGIRIFEASGEPLASIPVTGACNLTVDSHGDVYFSEPNGPTRKLQPSEFPVTLLTTYSTPSILDANPTWTVAVDASDNDILVDEGNQVAEYDPAGDRLGAFGAGGLQPLAGSTGLAIDTARHIYVTDNEGSPRQVQIFGTPSLLPPAIDATSATNLTATSAELTAKINPGGLSTSYRFQYGTSTSYGTSIPVPDAPIGEGFGDVTAEQRVEGLSPGVTYHWRVVAIGIGGTSTGVDHTFVYDTTGEALPDGRVYEMVTPPNKNAALIGVVFKGLPPNIADDGSRVFMTSIQCFANAESCIANRQLVGGQYFFSHTPVGWTTTSMAPPATLFTADSGWLASADTGMGLFSMPTPPAMEDDFYVRTAAGEFIDLGPATPPALGALGFGPFGVGVKVAPADFSHVVFQAKTPWVSEEAAQKSQLYELSDSGSPSMPVPVGVNGGPGSTDLISLCGSSFTSNPSSGPPGTISENGETVYFTAIRCRASANGGVEVPANTLYARIGQARTVKVSERSPTACTSAACQGSPPQNALFVGASNDGSKAFFLSNQSLADGAGEEGNLYEYDFNNKVGENLVDVSEDKNAGESPAVQGVVALSPDGSHVYFVAKGSLNGIPNEQGETAQGGSDNLYVFARDGEHPSGQIAFISRLPTTDAEGLWQSNTNRGSANVTPDGRYLVFESHGDLTADDLRTDGATQLFRYDAQTAELTRISVGERGFNDNGNAGAGNARIAPGYEGHERAGPARSDPTMSNDGEYIFFESPIGLVPHAVNDVQIGRNEGQPVYAENVYEWHEGQVHLISDVKDTTELANESAVKLIGSDTSGRNVFFRTAYALAPQDTDTQVDYYDARICTNSEPCNPLPARPLPPCLGEACHGIPSAAPGAPSGGSATLNGEGGPLPPRGKSSKPAKKRKRKVKCAKGKRLVRGHCMKSKAKSRKRGR
jgi:hypothetical protein